MATETDVGALVKLVSCEGVDFSSKQQVLKYILKLAASVEQTCAHLKGANKSDLVLRAIREVVQMSSLPQDQKESTLTWLDVVVPHVLAAAVSASKGEVKLQHDTIQCCLALLLR